MTHTHRMWLPLLAALIGTAALAQEIERGEKIEVTGSRIKRLDMETPAPVQVITRGDIEKSGKETIADVIRNIPADNNGSISLGFGTGFAAGGSAVSLRGLSSGSTLVLINGRRTAPYGLADDLVYDFVNLNTIPLDAVERIEVLKDGASAIYGSDAIAGVVNVILRNDYQGATIRASWGQTRYNDGDNSRFSLTAGKGDVAKDGYNFFVNVEAAKQDAIWQRDRASRAWIGDSDVRQWGYDLTTGTTLVHLGGWFRPATGPTLQTTGANPWGLVRNPATLGYVQLPGCNSPYTLSPGLGGCLQSLSDWRPLLPNDKSVSVLARGVFQPGASLQIYLEANVFRDNVNNLSFGSPSGIAGIWVDPQLTIHNNNTISLGPNHPDNPFGSTARLRYQTADVGPLRVDEETTVSRTVAGLKGSAWDWDFDSAFFYAESKTRTSRYGFLRDSVLHSLLDGSSPLGYYRLGINAHLNSAELYAALSPTLESESKTSVTSWDLKASRDLMRLRGGPLALAVGAEVRKEKLDNPPIPFTPQGDIVGWGYWEHHLERRVFSAYGELAAPILANVEVAAALRTDRYSDYGRSTTPKVGVRWTPVRELLVRGTYSEGFRAPGAAESGKSASSWSDVFRDPVRCPVTSAPDDCGAGRLVGINVGSPDVKPQESKSYTAGFVMDLARNASLSIDYWQIKRKNDFTYYSTNYVLENQALFPQLTVIREENNLPGIANSGTLLGIAGPYLNFGKTQTSGFDVDAKYRFDSGPYGRVSVELLWTFLRNFRKTFPDGDYTVEYAGTHGPTGLSSDAGTPRHRGTLTLTWENGPWTVSSATNYVSGVKNVEFKDDPNGCLNQFADGSDAPNGCHVGGFTTTSLFGRYRPTKELEIFGSIQNLFDRIAPLDPQTYGAYRFNVAYHLAGAIGRQYSIGARYSFK